MSLPESLQELSAEQLTSFICMYDQSYSPAAIALSMFIPEYDAYDMCEEYTAYIDHELECWAEEERMANEEWHDDCHFDDCGLDLTEAELDEIDRTTDWDAHAAGQRARIAEANEY